MRGLGHFAHLLALVPFGALGRSGQKFEQGFDGIDVPDPTYGFGALGEFRPNKYEAEPSQDEIDARPVVERALDTSNRWPK
jgi:hypothetical protein